MNEELELEQNMSDPVDDIVEDSDLEQGTNSTQPVLQEALGIDPEMAANAMKDQGFLPDNPVELAKEAGKALVGGGIDAVDSVGSFLDLSGDTILTGMSKLFGTEINDQNDITSKGYKRGAWWDIPDELAPENESGLGNLMRGLVEFGVLTVATGAVGGTVGGAVLKGAGITAARTGTQAYKAARLAGYGQKGAKMISFIPKGAKLGRIAAEGSIADLISTSSETANIANLVDDFAPFIPLSQALAVDPEKDGSWLARMKTITAGAGVNLLGHFLGGYVKGAYRAVKELKAGKTIDQANLAGNKVVQETMDEGFKIDGENMDRLASDAKAQGYGLSGKDNRLEYIEKHLEIEDAKEYKALIEGKDPSDLMRDRIIKNNPELDPETYPVDLVRELAVKDIEDLSEQVGRSKGDPWLADEDAGLEQLADAKLSQKDPFVDAPSFDNNEKAALRPDKPTIKEATEQNIEESVASMKRGDKPSSPSPIWTESTLKKITFGDVKIAKVLNEVATTVSEKLFKEQSTVSSLKRAYSPAEIKDLILRQTDEIQSAIVSGKDDFAQAISNYLNGKATNYIHYMHDGTALRVVTPATRHAMNLIILNLAEQVNSLAIAAKDLPAGANKLRQTDQMYDLMKVLTIEQKKSAFMAGNTLLQNKNALLDTFVKDMVDKEVSSIVGEATKYFDELKRVRKTMGKEAAATFEEIHRLSNGVVRHYDSINNYLMAKRTLNPYRMVAGTTVDGVKVRPRINDELASVYYNSLLSAPKTFIKAVASTNMIAIMRPLSAFVGAKLGGNAQEAVIAAAMLDSTGRAFAEGLQAFRHNWDLAVNKGKAQVYSGKFDVAKDLEDWNKLNKYYTQFAGKADSFAYSFLNGVVQFNTSPFSRYSTTIMGSGDALARTIIGRHEMRMRAARKAIDDGVDINNVREVAAKMENNFRDEIFTKVDNQWVVTDKAATLAGNESALTTALPANIAAFQTLQNIPVVGQFFFPFMRTGYNALRLTFSHTYLEKLSKKYDDIVNVSKTDPAVLKQYGIRPEDAAFHRSMMEGRMHAGMAMTGMVGIMAMSGGVTGDLPPDRETRELWKANGIQPNSFKLPNGSYVSYREMEPFNTLFALSANAFTNQHVLGEDVWDDVVSKITFMFGSILIDKSMLAGVDDLVTLFNANSSGGQIERLAARFARSAIPYSGLSRALGDVIQANQVEANNIGQMIVQRDLGFKAVVPPKYDILAKDRSGKPFIPSPTNPFLRVLNFVSPVTIGYAEGDIVKEALFEIGYNIPQELSYYDGEPLTSKEKSDLQKYMSTDVSFRSNLEAIVSNPEWKKSVQDYKNAGVLNRQGYEVNSTPFYQQIREEFIAVKERAMSQMLAENAQLADRVNLRRARTAQTGAGIYNKLENLKKHGI
tara:strand:+ start:4290 stop:8471 length:4182 start_codon:yes stop_codon:yes gene_type:complete